jgi:peptide/nickel transport system substrate-binding protein
MQKRRSLLKLVWFTLSLSLLIFLVISGCSSPGSTTPAPTGTQVGGTTATTPGGGVTTPQYGGIYRYGSSVPIVRVITESAPGMGIENAFDRTAYDTLLRLDENGDLAPYLATDWNIDTTNNTITLKLRQDVKFHDGTDFNAEAVKFSWGLRKDEYNNTVFNTVDSIDVVDDYTVRINLKQFDNTFLPALWFIPSQVSSPTNWQTLGKDKAELTMVGTGPFKLTEYDPDVGFTFERNDNYWQPGKPYLDGFVYKVIADPTTQELLFRNGEVDVPPIDADIQQRLKDTGQYQFVPAAAAPPFWELVPDSANPDSPWANLKVREAAEYAIDKETIAKNLGGPSAVAQYQWGPVGTYAYLPDLPARKYDPEKAKQLLAEAGYPNGFKTTAYVGATIQYVRDMELAVHEYWRKVGIDIEYVQLTLPTFLEKSRTGWDNGVMDGAPRIVPDWLSAAKGSWTTASKTATTFSKARSPELDDLIMRAISTPDMAERNRLSQQINKYISDNCLSIQIYTGGGIGGSLYQNNVHNVGGNLNYWGPSVYWGNADVWKSK